MRRLASSAAVRQLLALQQLVARFLQPGHVGQRDGEPLFLRRQRALRAARLLERCHRFAMQPAHLVGMPLLILEPAGEQFVTPVGEIDRRHQHHRDPVFATLMTIAVSAPAVPATMKLAALHRKSRPHVSAKVRFDDSAIAPATRLVLTKKYVPIAPTSGFATASPAVGGVVPPRTM